MSRFETVAEPEAPLDELYAEIVASGFGQKDPINWFTSQSSRPDVLAATWSLTEQLMCNGRLPPTITQMILMTLSSQNDCRYCAVTHTRVLQSLGVPNDVIESCVSDPDLAGVQEPHRSILKFSLKAAQGPRTLTEDDFEALRDLGVTDEEILEISMLVAFTSFINIWADVSGVPIDE